MAWDDWVGGILTGGMYNLGKASYGALKGTGAATEAIAEAAEQAGLAIATISSTFEALGRQTNSLLEEVEDLITINRMAPRDESDLWESEKDRLEDLREKKTKLKNKLDSLVEPNSGDYGNIFEWLSDFMEYTTKRYSIVSSLAAVEKEIHEILYEEPGVVTNAIYNGNEILERFNTMEQPKIEDILDSVDDNLDVSEELMKEIKKLFVVENKKVVEESDLSPELESKLDSLEIAKDYYNDLIQRNENISSQLLDAMKNMPADNFEISENAIKMSGSDDVTSKYFEKYEMEDIYRYKGLIGKKEYVDKGKMEVREDDPTEESSGGGNKVETMEEASIGDIISMSPMILPVGSKSKFSLNNIQPKGAKVSASLTTKFDGYQRTYESYNAKAAFYDRKISLIDKDIDNIKYTWVKKPGVIPETLDEMEGILENFRMKEQPRIDKTLDTLNENFEESKSILSKINDMMESSSMKSFGKPSKAMKIGVGIFAGLVVLNLLFTLIWLMKSVFGL